MTNTSDHNSIGPFIILTAIIVLSSSLSYVFLGALPFWFLMGSIGIFVSFVNRSLPRLFERSSGLRNLLYIWIIFIFLTLALDVVSLTPRNIMRGPILNALSFSAFVAATALASLTPNRRLIALVLASVALFQGGLCVAQFLGSEWAWRFWEHIRALAPALVRVDEESLSVAGYAGFDGFGRARGSHVFIHSFNGVQVALVGALLGLAVSPPPSLRARNGQLTFVRLGTLIGAIGVVLTFSRSGYLAAAAAVTLLLLLNFQLKTSLSVIVIAILALVSFNVLEIGKSSQFSRIFSFSSKAATNYERFNQYNYAFENIKRSPIVGETGVQNTVALSKPIHSVAIRYLNDYGAIGFLLYISICALIVRFFISGIGDRGPKYAEVRSWSIAGLCAFAAILADSSTHSSGFLRVDSFHGVLIATVIGTTLSARRSYTTRNAGSPVGRKRRVRTAEGSARIPSRQYGGTLLGYPK